MRFLFIHQNFPGQFVHLAPQLAQQGHQVVGLGIRPRDFQLPGVRQVLHQPQVPTIAGGHSPLVGELADLHAKLARGESAARSMEKLKREGFVPDVVVAHSGWGEAFYVKAVFPSAQLIVYAEYFYGAHGGDAGFDPEFSQITTASLQRTAIKNLHLLNALASCDKAISPTEFQKQQHPVALQSKISVLHEGVDTARFTPDPSARIQLRRHQLTLRPGDEVVTFVARQLEPYRGYHTFVRALPALQRLRPHARVVIVGADGVSYGSPPPAGTTWKNIFLEQVRDELDMSRIHFVGFLPHQHLTQLLQVSAAHVYLTYPFVVSWSLIEAMSIGCLVIGSDTAPVREIVQDGRNGLLCDFFDAQALAQRIAFALEHGPSLTPLRTQARADAIKRYDLHTHCLPQLVDFVTH